ncbi:MAG: VWA domain-containing protein, partial [bacterium]
MKKLVYLLVIVSGVFYFATCLAAEEIQVLVPGHKAKITHQVIDEKNLLISVSDDKDNPIRGLKPEDFVIQSGIKKAKILSAESVKTSQSVSLNIVLIVDNSFSMKERRAVEPLLSALDEFFKTLRTIDNVNVVVFDDKKVMKVKEYNLHTKTYRSKSIPELSRFLKLKEFLKDAFDNGLTGKTYLYEAMVAGINIIRKMPKKDHKFLVVFTDGEDLNSAFESPVVESEAAGIENFEVFCVDYMPRPQMDPFLKSFAENHHGRILKARSASELLPIFQAFSTTLLYRYVVTYRVLNPPHGTLSMEPAAFHFDMLTMLDGSPIMNKVFFNTGKGEISDNYVLFSNPNQTVSFDEKALNSVLDWHKNILNLVGKRLAQQPQAHIRIVGCNSDSGVEEGNL